MLSRVTDVCGYIRLHVDEIIERNLFGRLRAKQKESIKSFCNKNYYFLSADAESFISCLSVGVTTENE